MTPRANRIAFMIWRYCEPLGWDVTVQEIAAATGVQAAWVARTINAKGWSSRIRATKRNLQVSHRAHDWFVGWEDERDAVKEVTG